MLFTKVSKSITYITRITIFKKKIMAFIKKEYSDGFFNVGKNNGFLPKSIPLEKLPQLRKFF